MPDFALTAHAAAPVEEVWKLVHDPARFPEWWQGMETVRPGPGDVFTMWPEGYPDFPMDQRFAATPTPGRVTISCLVSDLVFTWELGPRVKRPTSTSGSRSRSRRSTVRRHSGSSSPSHSLH